MYIVLHIYNVHVLYDVHTGTESPALSPNSATPPVEKKIKLNTTADDGMSTLITHFSILFFITLFYHSLKIHYSVEY